MRIENNILIEVKSNDIENGTVIIPENVTEIGFYAFSYCLALETIKIPNSVTRIKEYAFCNCTSLETIAIPNSVIEIGELAFRDCFFLKRIILSNNLRIIESHAFSRCFSLKTITIPDSVIRIEHRAFNDDNLHSKPGNYKAFNKGLKCLGMQYKPHEWNVVDGEIVMCKHGLHYVTNMFDIFNYYYGDLEEDIEIWEIEPGDIIINDNKGSKKATNRIKPLKKLSRIEIINILNNK